jgi:hypothetical protein
MAKIKILPVPAQPPRSDPIGRAPGSLFLCGDYGRDAESGLYQADAREYHSSLGRNGAIGAAHEGPMGLGDDW